MVTKNIKQCTENGDKEDDDEDKMEVKKEELDKRISTISVDEDVNALVEGEDLSEDFQKKALQFLKARRQVQDSF